MRTRSTALLIVIVLIALGVAPALASTVTVDENGNGFFDAIPLTPVGPTPQGFEYLLPFVATDGTLFITATPADFGPGCVAIPFGPACDVVTFSNGNQMFFASAADDGLDSPAEVFPMPTGFTNPSQVNEIGPEGANGATYTPASGQAGVDASTPITYNFISDGVATPTPEPNTLILLGTGIVGTLGLVGLRGKTRLSS